MTPPELQKPPMAVIEDHPRSTLTPQCNQALACQARVTLFSGDSAEVGQEQCDAWEAVAEFRAR